MARSTGRVTEERDDAYWVGRAREGEQEAYGHLFERYREKAYRTAYRFLGHEEEAADATQDSFIKAFGALDGFEGRSKFSTWLMRIVTNTCLDRRRSQVSQPTVSWDDELTEVTSETEQVGAHRVTGAGERMEHEELKTALVEALGHLTEEHRTVFVLHTDEEMTYREIAEALSISEGTVMSRLYHARKNLQRMLGRRGILGEMSGREKESSDGT